MTKFRYFLAAITAVVALAIPSIPAPQAHAASGPWALTNNARTYILNSTVKLSGGSADTLKVKLFTSATDLSASSTTCSTVTNEVSSTNTGYTTGGATVTLSLSGTTTVTVVAGSSLVWTAGSANLTVNKAALCSTTADKVIAYRSIDSGGADVTTTSGQTYTMNFTGTPGTAYLFSWS